MALHLTSTTPKRDDAAPKHPRQGDHNHRRHCDPDCSHSAPSSPLVRDPAEREHPPCAVVPEPTTRRLRHISTRLHRENHHRAEAMAIPLAQHSLPTPLGSVPQHRRLARGRTAPRMVAIYDHHSNFANVTCPLPACAVDYQGRHTSALYRLCTHFATLHLHLGTRILRLRIWSQFWPYGLRGCHLVGLYEYDNRRLLHNPHNGHRQAFGCAIAAIWDVDAAAVYGLHLQHLPEGAKREGLNP